jgi:hypothetical protein
MQNQNLQELLQQAIQNGLPVPEAQPQDQPVHRPSQSGPDHSSGPSGDSTPPAPNRGRPGQPAEAVGDAEEDNLLSDEMPGDSAEPVGYNDNAPEVPDGPDVREVASRVNDALSQGDLATAASILGAVTSNMDIVAAQEYVDRLALKGNVQIQSNLNSLFLTTEGLQQPQILNRVLGGRQMQGVSYIGTYLNPAEMAEAH